MAKILIVDDSASIRDMLKIDLGNAGLEIIEAVDGEDGLIKASNLSPDLIICDLNMPGLDGLSMCSQLKKQGVNIPTFMLTTQNTAALKEEAKAIGVVAWIIKPYNKDMLIKGINKVLKL